MGAAPCARYRGHTARVEQMLRCLEGAPWGVYAEFIENAERRNITSDMWRR